MSIALSDMCYESCIFVGFIRHESNGHGFSFGHGESLNLLHVPSKKHLLALLMSLSVHSECPAHRMGLRIAQYGTNVDGLTAKLLQKFADEILAATCWQEDRQKLPARIKRKTATGIFVNRKCAEISNAFNVLPNKSPLDIFCCSVNIFLQSTNAR